MTKQDKVTVDDIIGIVKTEEQTNSVEEVRKLRGRENKTAKRFTINDCRVLSNEQILKILNQLTDENEQLKIALKDKENLISICEKKFKELGYLITCDDDGYVIE
jgi:hypothetical protein